MPGLQAVEIVGQPEHGLEQDLERRGHDLDPAERELHRQHAHLVHEQRRALELEQLQRAADLVESPRHAIRARSRVAALEPLLECALHLLDQRRQLAQDRRDRVDFDRLSHAHDPVVACTPSGAAGRLARVGLMVSRTVS
ncbi:MAG: hypothetical protein U5K43_03755 [Halofilum sp. (in: g-proteobacteria)]|nr:hypothetical protein [Halofilum sp. (in: g-proteobacteria)]